MGRKNVDRSGLRFFLTILCLVGVGAGLFVLWKTGGGEILSEKVAPVSISQPTKEPSERHNVIFISIDTVRADELTCYGAEGPEAAPTFCALAEAGTLFERAYSPAPVTLPAMTAVLSDSLVSNEEPRELAAHYRGKQFLAEKLAARGFRTAAFTDHLGLGDVEAGRRAIIDFHRGFEVFVNIGVDNNTLGSPSLVDRAVAFLDEHPGEPVFLWLHFFDPHFNYGPPDSLARLFGYDEEACGRVRAGMDIVALRDIRASLDDRELACLRALHRAEIRYVDDELARLVERVEEPDLAPRTNLVVFADHGEEFMERGWIGHERTLFDENIRVPFALAGPQVAKQRVRQPVSTLAAHQAALALSEGRPAKIPSGTVYSRTFHYYPTGNPERPYRSVPNSFASIDGGYKHVINPSHNRHRCFDVSADPSELNDLCGLQKSDQQGSAASLLRWVANSRVETASAPAEAIEAQNELFERLRALGYFRD